MIRKCADDAALMPHAGADLQSQSEKKLTLLSKCSLKMVNASAIRAPSQGATP
jgi:hypothetical protein